MIITLTREAPVRPQPVTEITLTLTPGEFHALRHAVSDLVRGRLLWEVPLGDLDHISKQFNEVDL